MGSTSADDAPVISDKYLGAVNRGMLLNETITVSGDEPIDLSDFTFHSFVPLIPGQSGPLLPATFDPVVRLFSWDTTGSPGGEYEWRVTATNQFGSDQGSISVFLNVPEPGAISLVGMALAALLSCFRRRSR
jgi:hypothetical protein